MATSYKWLFLWDYTFYKWGFLIHSYITTLVTSFALSRVTHEHGLFTNLI